MSEPAIPRRFNSAAVARYENVMRSLCASWPDPILVDPKPLAVETFRCRFRDALKGVRVYSQGSEELQTMVNRLNEEVSVVEDGGKLRIGPTRLVNKRSASKPSAGLLLSGSATIADETNPLNSPDKQIIQAIALLTACGFLSGAKVGGVTEQFIYDCFPEDYEGGVVENADGSFTIY